MLDGYIAGRKADAKPRTLVNLGQARKRLGAFFGADKPLHDLTEADAPADAFAQASDGAVYVIARYRDTEANLRTLLRRIIERAGLVSWPKLFHNLRASRQTELVECHPIHAVCAWLGNSAAIAKEHYLQVTEAHYQRAAQIPAPSAAERACQRETALAVEIEMSTKTTTCT